jgi:LmbE family N-acetylglucosaminyl deacetylase
MAQEPAAENEGAKRAMVVIAHPDDAEFLCGGTIARWCAEGWEVIYVVTTNGDRGSHDIEVNPRTLAMVRQDEQRRACDVLGVKDCIFMGYGDGFIEDTVEFRSRMVKEIRRFRPDIVLTWDAFRRGFNHREHRITGQVAIDAVYPLARSPLYFEEHLLEGLRGHECNEVWLAGTDQPDHWVDVSDYFETKLDAILCHESQIRQRSREQMAEMMRKRSAETGNDQNMAMAEAFRRVTWGNR